jgi:hypothetical protein
VGVCWVVIFFVVKEQSIDWLVEVDRLGEGSTREVEVIDGQVERSVDKRFSGGRVATD